MTVNEPLILPTNAGSRWVGPASNILVSPAEQAPFSICLLCIKLFSNEQVLVDYRSIP